MTAGQDKPVAIGPSRIGRVETQVILPQRVHHRRQGHGGSRVAGIGLLNRIHGKCPDGIDAQLIDVLRHRHAHFECPRMWIALILTDPGDGSDVQDLWFDLRPGV